MPELGLCAVAVHLTDNLSVMVMVQCGVVWWWVWFEGWVLQQWMCYDEDEIASALGRAHNLMKFTGYKGAFVSERCILCNYIH